MAKQLRLDVAQLTDVGRKREHNEDNMAYVIPKDPQVMATKGSLFIVADGMGGHAAGEVASEIAVDTVSTAYYQDEGDEVPVSLIRAIKRANAAIHQRAAENMLRSGMGTTCVAAVLRGNMAYIANVGDSRAYLIRGKTVKQISQDHSWVAEQVRAGLLTEDQARTHAQRNVITRSLGTQPDVDIDIFIEPLQEGDSLVLCTDGLSGLITEDELQEIVNRFVPQESVYHLVERANENGGPDNITAIVIRVNEVGWEPPPRSRHPVAVGGPDEDTVILDTAAASSAHTAPRYGNGHSGPLSFVASGSTPALAEAPAAPLPHQKTLARRLGRHGRISYLNVAFILVCLLALSVGIGYYWLLRSGPNVDQVLAQANELIRRASSEAVSNPPRALQDLAAAQQELRSLQGVSLSDAQRKQLATLQQQLAGQARLAFTNYDQQEHITPLSCAGATVSAINNGSINTQPRSIAVLQQKGKPFLYALGEDGQLYALQQMNHQYSMLSPLALEGRVLNMAAAEDGSQLFLLIARAGQNGTATTYELAALAPGAAKARSQPISSSLTARDQAPSLIAVWGSDVYVLFSSKQLPNSAQLVDYDPAKLTARQTPLSISGDVVSLAAFPNNQLFLLEVDGTLQSLQYSGAQQQALPAPVKVQPSIPMALSVTAQNFNAATPVPTVVVSASAQQAVPVNIPNRAVLSSGLINHTPYLYISDGPDHRLLALTPLGGGATGESGGVILRLAAQYASPDVFATLRMAQPDPTTGTLVYALTQNSASLLTLVSLNANPPSSCV